MHVLTIDQVSAKLKKSVSTVRTDMVRRPGDLPRWFKLPGGKKPLWLEATVDQFLRVQAEEANALPVGKKK
jgi:predicted DNA-binding transcriptional regulator AlpA